MTTTLSKIKIFISNGDTLSSSNDVSLNDQMSTAWIFSTHRKINLSHTTHSNKPLTLIFEYPIKYIHFI